MNQEQIRRDQINEGNRRTLSANRPKHQSNGAKKQFVAKGHDAILKNFQDNGTTISVTMMGDGTVIIGTLLARDKFTLTVKALDGSQRTIYKHAIESFGPFAKVQ